MARESISMGFTLLSVACTGQLVSNRSGRQANTSSRLRPGVPVAPHILLTSPKSRMSSRRTTTQTIESARSQVQLHLFAIDNNNFETFRPSQEEHPIQDTANVCIWFVRTGFFHCCKLITSMDADVKSENMHTHGFQIVAKWKCRSRGSSHACQW